MDHFDVTTGVLDSWDLLNHPLLDTFVDRNKERVQVSSLNLFQSSSSFLLKKTSYTPVLNSISAGYYPVLNGLYKSCPSTFDKPLIQVTVSPRSQKTSTTDAHHRKQHRKRTRSNSNHSVCSKKIYIVVPGTRKDKVYSIETTNAKIFKEINDNKLLSECMVKSYFRSMNKTKKKTSDKVKEKGNLRTIPECSPDCAFMSLNKSRNASPDRSGSASPRSPRTGYKTVTKVETKKSTTTIATQKRTTKSPDRLNQKDDDARAKSPDRTNRPKTRISIYHSDKIKKEEKSPERYSYIGDKRSIESVIAEEKRRSPERYEKRFSTSGRPERIRITGRLGIDKDDKCVLKCNATLNDEPIATQFQGAPCAMLPMCFQACTQENRKQRDANIQVKETPGNGRRYSPPCIGKESQGTQVDFQMSYSTTIPYQRGECGRGKIQQQCACVNTVDNQIFEAKENTGSPIKKHHSPLIVISVYSQNDASSVSSGELKHKSIKATEQKKEIKKIGRSRSPSPAKSSKKTVGKKSDTRVNATKKTVRETARKETRSKLNQTQSRSEVRSTVTKTKVESRTSKSKSSKAQKTPPQSQRSMSPRTEKQEANATEQMKRALIDDFTKSYTEQLNNKNTHLEIPLQTKHNVSNITIDIEGDSEYYNVKLEQDVGKLNTELTVRKPTRGKGGGGGSNDMVMGEKDDTSLENFLYMPEDEHRKRSFSQTLMFDGLDLTMNSDLGNDHELNVRDSIEISHRREHRASIVGNHERNDSNAIPKEVDTKRLAQSKHYKGDDCLISDPDARDREIRKLLGIDKGVNKYRTRPSQLSNVEKSIQIPLPSVHESSSSATRTNMKTEEPTKDPTDSANTIIIALPLYRIHCSQNMQLLYKLSLRKPIVLTLRQYAKVKRIVYNRLMAKHSTKLYNSDRRLFDCRLKFVKTDTYFKNLHYDKDSQTDGELTDNHASNDNTYTIHNNSGDANPACKTKDKSSSNTDQETSNANCTKQVINYNNYYMHNVLKTVYIAAEKVPIKKRFKEELLKKAASVKDIHFRKMGLTKHKVRFSSSDSGKYISKAQAVVKKSCSIHTIFKCHQKSITPNLGTSAYSLCNGEPFDSRPKFFEDSTPDLGAKKPFLRRLLSCLVFKVSPPLEVKHPGVIEGGSPCTSFDSYHVSTSVGAMEMSSSLYDTTASFYSEHSVPGVKKRGFLSSVRGLLARNH